MSIRCKFKVIEVSKRVNDSNVILEAVTGGSPENDKFWDYTPSGKLEFSANPIALENVKPGQEYYLDLTLAD